MGEKQTLQSCEVQKQECMSSYYTVPLQKHMIPGMRQHHEYNQPLPETWGDPTSSLHREKQEGKPCETTE